MNVELIWYLAGAEEDIQAQEVYADDGWVGDGVEYDRVLRINHYDRG